MKKIVNYISNGNGFGLRWLFLFSVILSLSLAILVKVYGNTLVPSAQDIASQVLPLKVVEGEVVTPNGIDKTIKMKISENLPEVTFPFIINTTVDTLETKNLQPGIYLTKTAFYTVNNGKIEIKKLEGSFEIPQGDYTDTFKELVTYIASVFGLIMVPVFFVAFLLLALVCSLTALVLLKIFEKQAGFDMRMRLSCCAIILMYSLKYLINLTGATVSSLLIFAFIIAFQGIFIYKGLPELKVKKRRVKAKN